MVKQVTHRRADTRPDVARTAHGLTGQRHHAFGQRLAVNNGALHRKRGADVLHQHADIRRTAAVRHLFTGQDLGQLFRATRRVFGGDHAQADFVLTMEHGAHHGNRLRLVVFDADQHFARLQNMREDAHAVDDLRGAVLHQAVIGGDIRLALGGVNDKRLDFIAAALQFGAGRETGAAEPRHAKRMDALNQRLAAAALVIAPAVAGYPAVFAVGVDDH
ncbi:hypothetical protein BN133_744 [Cronobacter dublinensis 582]|nr:hypothetical protein BN133_744 [Cronobacter dublinensis 582]